MTNTIELQITNLINDNINIKYFAIENESHKHSANLGTESHFKLTIVSNDWQSLSKVKRHQKIYKLLGNIMNSIHALALHLYTEQEWVATGQSRPASPNCHSKT